MKRKKQVIIVVFRFKPEKLIYSEKMSRFFNRLSWKPPKSKLLFLIQTSLFIEYSLHYLHDGHMDTTLHKLTSYEQPLKAKMSQYAHLVVLAKAIGEDLGQEG